MSRMTGQNTRLLTKLNATGGPRFRIENGQPQYLTDTWHDLSVVQGEGDHDPVTAGNAGISVAGQAVSAVVDPAGGLEIASGIAIDLATNSGLQFNSGLELKLVSGGGITKDVNGLTAITPGTLSASTTNSKSLSTHAINAASNVVAGAVESLLKSTSTGALSLDRLGVGAAADTAAALKVQATAVDDYTLWLKKLSGQTADMWRVEDTGGDALIRLTGGGDLESGTPQFTSGQVGWQITADGNAEFNNARIRGELHAVTFVAEEMSAMGGTLLVKTAGKVGAPQSAGDNTLPAAIDQSFTLVVEASWATGANYFPPDSILRIKPMGEVPAGGSLDHYDFYLDITAESDNLDRDLANGNPGTFDLTAWWKLGGAAGFVIPTGTAVVLWAKKEANPTGRTGAIKLTADGDIDDVLESPFIDVFTVTNVAPGSWSGVAPTTIPRVRVGNLRGVLGKSVDEWGMAAGTDLGGSSAAGKYIVASDLGLVLRNIDWKSYNGEYPTIEATSAGNLKLGTDINTAATTAFDFVSSTGALRIGSIGTNKPNLYWDGTDLHLRNNISPVITLEGDGDSFFSGRMTIDDSGEIVQGGGVKGTVGNWAGTWGSFTGLRIGNDAGIGRLATYNAGVVQVSFDTTGTLVAGGGKTTLNALGLRLQASAASGGFFDAMGETGAVRFYTSGGIAAGYVYGRATTDGTQRSVWLAPGGGGTNRVWVSSHDGIAAFADKVLVGGSVGSAITLQGNTTNTGTLTVTGAVSIGSGSITGLTNLSSASVQSSGAVAATTTISTQGGISSNFGGTPGQGQFVSDLEGADFNSVVLTDSTDVSHPMTALLGGTTYGALGKVIADEGGLSIVGATNDVRGVQIVGYATNVDSLTSNSAIGTVTINTGRSNGGTGATGLGANENVFVVRNNSTAMFIVKGDGDIYYNGADQGTFDAYDDVALLRTLSKEAWQGAIDSVWDRFVTTNRHHLIHSGVMSEDGFINGSALGRLLTGALWQIHERVSQLESQLA